VQTDDVIAVIRAAMQRDGGKRTEEDVGIYHGVVLSIMLRRGNNRHVLSIMLRRTCSTHVVSTTTTQYSIRNREFNSCWELASCLVGLQLLHCGDSIVPRPQMLTIFPVPNEAVMPPSRTGCSPATRSDLSIAKKPI